MIKINSDPKIKKMNKNFKKIKLILFFKKNISKKGKKSKIVLLALMTMCAKKVWYFKIEIIKTINIFLKK